MSTNPRRQFRESKKHYCQIKIPIRESNTIYCSLKIISLFVLYELAQKVYKWVMRGVRRLERSSEVGCGMMADEMTRRTQIEVKIDIVRE